MNTISIIVPTRQPTGHFTETVESLLHQRGAKVQHEIVVVDNSPAPVAHGVLAGLRCPWPPRLKVVHEPNPGLVAARHRGVHEAQGEILAFIDDDVIVSPTWLASLAEGFCDSETQFVGGRNLPRYEAPRPPWLDAFVLRRNPGWMCCYLSLLDLGDKPLTIEPSLVWGLNMAIRRSTLLELGGFHPDSFPWPLRRFRGDGETGLMQNAAQRGLSARYLPGAAVRHRIPAARLRPSYFQRRAFLEGISRSYSEIRAAGELPHASALRRLAHAFRTEIRVAAVLTTPDTTALRLASSAAYWSGYAYHRGEAARDRDLRHWITRDNYWDYRLPGAAR